MLTIKTFVFNEFYVNTFVLSDETGNCVIIDPGCNNNLQKDELKNYIEKKQLKPALIINTHGHIDHIAGNSFVKSLYNIPLALHENDLFLIENALHYAEFFGFDAEMSPVPDRWLKEKDEIIFGNSHLSVFHLPGHSPGSVVLYSKNDKVLFAGDVLFNGSIGRTDLPGGDYNTLIRGIKEKIMVLPPETTLYPGHGPITTIQLEYDTNPFLHNL
jgi:glyoxylase-like metal-dependent hydrolase (beta-lactamase superfamily II)